MRLLRRTTRQAAWAAGAAASGVLLTALAVPSAGSARAHAAPRNTGEPRVTGTTIEGHRLTADDGTWSGTTPFRFTYRWLRCDPSGGGVNGAACGAIPGATGRTYLLGRLDVGARLRVRVTAANAEGSATATSNATAGVVLSAAAAGRPANTSPPTISGRAAVNETLTANPGSWAGGQPQTVAFQWQRCDANGGSCNAIGGASRNTYVLTTADLGTTLRVRVTARNTHGSSSATSVPTAVVVKASPPSGATVSIGDVSLPNHLLIDGVTLSPQPLRSRRTIVARFHVSDSEQHPVAGALVFALGIPFGLVTNAPEQATGADGWVTFTFQPTARVRFGRPGSIVFFVRARKSGERLIGGISTRRLVNLSVR
jgi:hypothetical protein